MLRCTNRFVGTTDYYVQTVDVRGVDIARYLSDRATARWGWDTVEYALDKMTSDHWTHIPSKLGLPPGV